MPTLPCTLPYHACADAVVHMRSVNPPLEQREGLREGESFAMRNIWRHEMNKFSWPEKGFMSQFTDTPPTPQPPTYSALPSLNVATPSILVFNFCVCMVGVCQFSSRLFTGVQGATFIKGYRRNKERGPRGASAECTCWVNQSAHANGRTCTASFIFIVASGVPALVYYCRC